MGAAQALNEINLAKTFTVKEKRKCVCACLFSKKTDKQILVINNKTSFLAFMGKLGNQRLSFNEKRVRRLNMLLVLTSAHSNWSGKLIGQIAFWLA